MNSRRPSNPNLPSVPKPSKLFAPTRLRWTFFFSNLPDSAITHQPISIGPFLTASQAPKSLLTYMSMVRKVLTNEPLKDVTMEKVRVEEFGESICKDCGWVNLVFVWSFSLKILSGSSLHFVGIRGIYTGVCLECEESIFPKQIGLVTWPRDLTESRVHATS